MCSDIERIIRKMEANAFYPTPVPSVFRFFDPEVAKAVTETARKETARLASVFGIAK